MNEIELQVDRIVGPLHHFGGLGLGNLASQRHAGQVSHPAAAAIEGLDKMRLVASLGVPQLILPPQQRPAFAFLRSLGFVGADADVLESAMRSSPQILSAACSSSAMWTANAATVTAASDTSDGRIKLTVANLTTSMHRSLEPMETLSQLVRMFESLSVIEQVDMFPPIDGGFAFRDEGAANHFRLVGRASREGRIRAGLNVFVYGNDDPLPARYQPRQSRLACETIARRHGLNPTRTFHLKQHPEAIDAGAFHNDVVAMSHEDVLIHHERAFWRAESALEQISEVFHQMTGCVLHRLSVPESVLSLRDAVSTYLFNSQIVTTPGPESRRVLICPSQVRDHSVAKKLVETWRNNDRLFDEVHFVQLQESMAGGGGPACLRLRIPIDSRLVPKLAPACMWSEQTDYALRKVIESAYPKELRITDLAKPEWIDNSMQAVRRVQEVLR
jgi:succinylarginine dihydrolase